MRGMSRNTITVVYPALMKWVRTLDTWSTLAAQSTPKAATQAVWGGNRDAIHRWIEQGHRLMTMAQFSPNIAQELMDLVKAGCIDPTAVGTQLAHQGWEYQFYDDYGDNSDVEYVPLSESWTEAIGCAMVLTKTVLPWGNHSAAWLEEGCGLFVLGTNDALQTCTSLIDKSHEEWLYHLCSTQAGAREAVALRCLEEGSMPRWTWIFHDDLAHAPSTRFIAEVLQLLDKCTLPGSDPSEKVELLKTHAPAFHSCLAQAQNVYAALYGPVPEGLLDSLHYCENRAETVRSMFVQGQLDYPAKAGLVEVSSTSPSMEKLFCTDEPSNAF